MIIRDPNSGDGMHVTPDGHGAVAARTESLAEAEALEGWAFNFNTGDITLTNAATANGVAYMKNTSEAVYIIPSIIYIFGNSTSGTGDGLVEILRNPTAGTVISDASEQVPVNRNFGSSNTLTCNCYKASGSGKTLTGGTVLLETRLSSPLGRVFIAPGSIILEPGSSIGIRYTTQASNSSQIVQFAMSIHRLTLGT